MTDEEKELREAAEEALDCFLHLDLFDEYEAERSDIRTLIAHLEAKAIVLKRQCDRFAERVATLEERLAKAEAEKERAFEAARERERIDLGDGESIEGRHARYETYADWAKAGEQHTSNDLTRRGDALNKSGEINMRGKVTT